MQNTTNTWKWASFASILEAANHKHQLHFFTQTIGNGNYSKNTVNNSITLIEYIGIYLKNV